MYDIDVPFWYLPTFVRGAPQNGDGRVEADFAIMRLTAQPHHKICIFSNVAPKILENAENAHTQKKNRATRSRLVYRDDAEGDWPWASRCRSRENTSRRQAKKLQPLRKPGHFQHLSNEDESGRLKPELMSLVVDLVDLVMSRDHQNDNAVWLCRVTKKK